jgi:regulator of sigma E protease
VSYLAILFLLSLLIVIHEAGHLAAARLAGIPVDSFAVGFGPKLWARRWGRTEYSLRAIPLGGFVLPALDEPSDFRRTPLPRRLVFFLGGPLANLAAALPLFAVLNGTPGSWSFYGTFVAPFGQLAAGISKLLVALPALFSGNQPLQGVIGIVAVGGPLAEAGLILQIAVSLSISLAVLNLLPIPVLDGGQILLGCLEELFPRFTRLREPLTVLGMVVLAAVLIYANVRDVVRIWG